MRVCAVLGGMSTQRAAEAGHVLRTLLGTLGVPHDIAADVPASSAGRVLLCYGCPLPPGRVGVEIPCAESPTPEEAIAIHRRVAGEGAALFAVDGSRVRVAVDLIGAAGLWLTGAEERQASRDAFGRVCGAASPRHQAGLLRTPVVADLMHLLWAALSRANAAGLALVRVPAWPEGRKFAVLLSHDVDLWRKRTARQLAKELVRSLLAPRRLGLVARAFCRGPDPWADLGHIADLEERHGMHSTFFVFAGRPNQTLHGVGVVNRYDAKPKAVRDTLGRLAARGWEVGLHGSYDSFASAEQLAGERADVDALSGEQVWGCRQHFLRFDWPGTWRAQAKARLRYDATLGYHDADGYRAGFSFPFRAFAGEDLPLLELPLAVADGALRDHQRLDAEAAWERLRSHLERAEADGSMLGLLWHNTYFCELDAPGYPGVYERALAWIREHGGWGASAREICEWWTRRAILVDQAG